MRQVIINYKDGEYLLGLLENHEVKAVRVVTNELDIPIIINRWIIHGSPN